MPCVILAPYESETIIDISAGPVGKTTYIAALMKNRGIIIANDINKNKLVAAITNIHRMNVKNVIVCHSDGNDLPSLIGPGSMDRILLDAPCSGTGIVSKDPRIKMNKTRDTICCCVRTQKQLILSAIDLIDAKSRTGGYLVYSTCSLLVEENECIINFALNQRDISIVQCGIEFGRKGFVNYKSYQFHPSLDRSRRFYPHLHNTDAFFVCKIKKNHGNPS